MLSAVLVVKRRSKKSFLLNMERKINFVILSLEGVFSRMFFV